MMHNKQIRIGGMAKREGPRSKEEKGMEKRRRIEGRGEEKEKRRKTT